MNSSTPLIDLSKSCQVDFATNLQNGSTRGSEYMNTNFDELKKVREMHVHDQDYDTSSGNARLNFDDYYAGLRANDEHSELKGGNVFLKFNYKENKRKFLLHCALLLIAIICGSSVGVFYFYIQPQNQLLKASWRMLFLALCILPFAIFEYKREKERYIYSKEALWDREIWRKLFLASLGYSIWTIALVIAVNHTSIAQANLLISIHPVMLMFYKMIQKTKILSLEITGSVLVAIGISLVFFDGDIDSFGGHVDLKTISSWSRNGLGNIIAIIGSIGGAIYYTKNHELKNEYPFFLGILMMTILGFIWISLTSLIFESTSFTFDPNTGMFGFLAGEWLGVYVLTIIVTGFGVYIGYLVSSKYFEPLLLHIVQHTEPFFATILIVCLGWQSFPGVLTLFAFLLIIPGVVLTSLGNKEGEVREFDILDDSYANTLPVSNHVNIETKLVRAPSLTRQRLSVSAPVGWEK